MPKVALVIAPEDFRDEEYLEPKKVLEENNIQVATVSVIKGKAIGKLGALAQADTSINDLDPSEYDGIFFIGGPGATAYFQNRKAHEIIKAVLGKGKLIGAICAGSATLAYAGVLKGKKATSFSGVSDILKNAGAIFTGKDLETDGKIITADGPLSAKKFGHAIADALKNMP